MAVPVCQKESGAVLISSYFGGNVERRREEAVICQNKAGVADGVGGAEP